MIKSVLTGLTAFTAVAIAAAPSAAVTNLLTNGSFETGDFTGWTYVQNTTDGQVPVVIKYNTAPGAASAYTGTNGTGGAYGESVPADNLSNPFGVSPGNFGAYFLSDRTAGDSISQSIALAANTSYTVGFDYYLPFNGFSNPGDASLTVSFAGQQVAFFDTSAGSAGTQPGTWRSISYTFSTGNVVAPTGVLQFLYNAPGNDRFGKDFVVDSLFVTATSDLPVVPEAATWAMMVAGFGMMGVAMRRKRTSVAFSA